MSKLYQDGLLNLDISGTTPAIRWTIFIVCFLALLTQCIIAYVAFRKMRITPEVNNKVKWLFILCLVCAITHTVVTIISRAVSLATEQRYWVISLIPLMAHYSFFVLLLTNLVLRLHITFQGSIYKMSKYMYFSFFVILSLLMTIPILFWPVFIIIIVYFYGGVASHNDVPDSLMTIAYDVVVSFFILFFIGSALAVYYFVHNLIKVATARRISVLENRTFDMELDQKQMLMCDLSARYVWLFVVATLSTVVLGAAFNVVSYESGIRNIVFPIDSCINLWCLVLQFAFAKEHYRRCCGWCDRCCRELITARTRSIQIKRNRLQSQTTDMDL